VTIWARGFSPAICTGGVASRPSTRRPRRHICRIPWRRENSVPPLTDAVMVFLTFSHPARSAQWLGAGRRIARFFRAGSCKASFGRKPETKDDLQVRICACAFPAQQRFGAVQLSGPSRKSETTRSTRAVLFRRAPSIARCPLLEGASIHAAAAGEGKAARIQWNPQTGPRLHQEGWWAMGPVRWAGGLGGLRGGGVHFACHSPQ